MSALLKVQLHENELVLKELEHVKDSACMYRTVGNMCVEINRGHAIEVVNRRLEFINNQVSNSKPK